MFAQMLTGSSWVVILNFPELESSITASDPLPLAAEDKKPG